MSVAGMLAILAAATGRLSLQVGSMPGNARGVKKGGRR